MKVSLYMAITANGKIANKESDTSWISKESWATYQQNVEAVDCVIIGRKTYEIMPSSEFLGKEYIVYTQEKNLDRKAKNIIFTNEDPKKLIASLKKRGLKNILICGGGEINGFFLTNDLIDELFLDVEPKVLGRGIELFGSFGGEANLELLGTKMLNKNTIQLHYKVIK